MAGGPFGLLPTIKPSELLFAGEHRKGKGDGAYGTVPDQTNMRRVVVEFQHPIHHPFRGWVAEAEVSVTGLDGMGKTGQCSHHFLNLFAMIGMPSFSRVRLTGRWDRSTSRIISSFSDAGYLIRRRPHPRSCFF